MCDVPVLGLSRIALPFPTSWDMARRAWMRFPIYPSISVIACNKIALLRGCARVFVPHRAFHAPFVTVAFHVIPHVKGILTFRTAERSGTQSPPSVRAQQRMACAPRSCCGGFLPQKSRSPALSMIPRLPERSGPERKWSTHGLRCGAAPPSTVINRAPKLSC